MNPASAPLTRRAWLKLSAGALGLASSPWYRPMALRAAEPRRKHKQCIFLFMGGGPSQVNTFDPKPGAPLQAIQTSVPGISICENFPHLAKQAHHLAILRSLTNKQGGHDGGIAVHTGFMTRNAGGVTRPTLGAFAARELGRPEFDLPSHIVAGSGYTNPGYLGARYAAFRPALDTRGKDPIPDRLPTVPLEEFDRRLDLIKSLNRDFHERYQADSSTGHTAVYEQAGRLVHTAKVAALKIDDEPDAVKESYGLHVKPASGRYDHKIAQQCLLARRLIEAGVPFVEIGYGGLAWDSHAGVLGPLEDHRLLAAEMDRAAAFLIGDLKDRGLLDNTLIVLVGEFGRSGLNGTNHHPKAFTAVLAGAGLKAGQVIGATTKDGNEVAESPISMGDFLATLLHALGIDYTKEYQVGSRPIGAVDAGASPVKELFA